MPKNGKPVESTNDIVVAEGTYEGVNVKFEDDTSWYVKCTNDGCNNATAQNKVGVNKVNHNLNTSAEHYREICTTHTYQDRINTLKAVRDAGLHSGLAINPATPPDHVLGLVGMFDHLLCMTVNPGWGGQESLPGSLEKIGGLRAVVGDQPALEVDGGIGRETIGAMWRAGADTYVAGNAIFGAADPAAEIAALRASCTEMV
jgi:pentose-5-phosphate-3-epimerase